MSLQCGTVAIPSFIEWRSQDRSAVLNHDVELVCCSVFSLCHSQCGSVCGLVRLRKMRPQQNCHPICRCQGGEKVWNLLISSTVSQNVMCLQITWGILLKGRSRFSRSGVRPEALHFQWAPRWYSSCQSTNYTVNVQCIEDDTSSEIPWSWYVITTFLPLPFSTLGQDWPQVSGLMSQLVGPSR